MDLLLIVQCLLLIGCAVCLWFVSPWLLLAVACGVGFGVVEWRGRS